jgi:hypothetical protein
MLQPIIQHLDQALAANPRGDEIQWAERLTTVLTRIVEALRQHESELESPGGLFDMIDLARPALVQELDDLRGQHADLVAKAHALQSELRKAVRTFALALDRDALLAAGRKTEEFAAALKDHWETEADLVIECVIRDIGGRFNNLLCAVTPHS